MADTLKGTKHQLTGTGDVTIATSANVGTTILSVSLCNTESDDPCTFTLRVRDNGSADYYIYHTQSLPSYGTFVHNAKICLLPNDILVANLDAASQVVDVYVSKLEQTS